MEYVNSENSYQLLDYDQFSQSLSKSIVVSINNNSVNLPDLNSERLSNINVDRVSLVYLLDEPGNKTLQPVFLIEGVVDVAGTGNDLNITMYLPAFSSDTP